MTRDSSYDVGAEVDGSSTAEPTGVVTSARPPVRPGSRRLPRRRMPAWQESILLVGLALILALIVKTFFVQAFYIPSGSMRDTLHVNDRILVEKWSYWFGDIHRGDIVVFDDPAHWLAEEDAANPTNLVTKVLGKVGLFPTGGHLVKRVIGVGGDTVACTTTGVLEVNGQPLEEKSYVTLARRSCDSKFRVVVPPGHLWVMGDNRQDSADSRAHTGDPGGGYIPDSDVVGKVFVVMWPIDRFAFIHRPGTFDNPALDRAASFISVTTPPGLALLAVPPLLRRLRARNTARDDVR